MKIELVRRLEALLEAERNALCGGDLERIESLLAEKRALSEELAALPQPVAELAPLRERLQRNTVLYDVALAGIRRVVHRLGTLHELRRTLETYDARGKRQSVADTVEHRLEKRA